MVDNKIVARFPALIGLVIGVFVLALFLYFFRGSLAAFQLSKEQAGFWDIIVKFVVSNCPILQTNDSYRPV